MLMLCFTLPHQCGKVYHLTLPIVHVTCHERKTANVPNCLPKLLSTKELLLLAEHLQKFSKPDRIGE